MKHLFHLSLIGYCLLLFFPSRTQGQDKEDRANCSREPITACSFLQLAPDAIAAGLGHASTASMPDGYSMLHNPAKLAFTGGASSQNTWMDDYQAAHGLAVSCLPNRSAAFGNSLLASVNAWIKLDDDNFYGNSALGFSFLWYTQGNFDLRGETSGYFGIASPGGMSVMGSYAKVLGDAFSLGVNFKYLQEKSFHPALQTMQTSHAIAADLGIYGSVALTYEGNEVVDLFRYGLVLSNLGNKMGENGEERFLPATLSIGAGYQTSWFGYDEDIHTLSFSGQAAKLLVPTPPVRNNVGWISSGKNDDVSVLEGIMQSFYDAPGGIKEELQEIILGTGLQYQYNHLFALRAGYHFENPLKGHRHFFSAGTGVKLHMETFFLALDLAYIRSLAKAAIGKNQLLLSVSIGL